MIPFTTSANEQIQFHSPISLRTIILSLSGLTTLFSISILSTTAHLLWSYTNASTTNPWFIPLWPAHFRLSDVRAEIISAAALFALNAAILVSEALSWSTKAPQRRNLIGVVAAGTAPLVAVIGGLIFPGIVNTTAFPSRDTLRSWTCRWSGAPRASGAPANLHAPSWFGGLCAESRFAYFGFIPLLLLQIVLLICVWSSFQAKRRGASAEGDFESGKEGRWGKLDQESISEVGVHVIRLDKGLSIVVKS